MTDIIVNKQNIETGTHNAVTGLVSTYPDAESVRQAIVNGGYLGLNISPDVRSLLNSGVSESSFADSLYNNIGNETQSAVSGYVLDMGEKALDSQKGLALTYTSQIKALVVQGYTIEQAMVKITQSGNLNVYIEKTTGFLVRSETVLSETTHVPVGKVLSGAGKMLGAYGIYETLKDTVADAYAATTGAGNSIEPVKSYLAMGAGVLAGGAIAVFLLDPLTALPALAFGALGGGFTTGIIKTVLDALPQMIDSAKAAGHSLAQVYYDVSALIADKIEDAYSATGTAARNLLNEADGYSKGFAEGIRTARGRLRLGAEESGCGARGIALLAISCGWGSGWIGGI